ncbi:MAG: hypothetical protein ACOYJ2_01145 [Rickettsiales bacterium]
MPIEQNNIMTGTPRAGVGGLTGTIDPASIEARPGGITELRQDVDWLQLITQFIEMFANMVSGRSNDDDRTPDRDRDAAPPATQPGGTAVTTPDAQPQPVITITGTNLSNRDNLDIPSTINPELAEAIPRVLEIVKEGRGRNLTAKERQFITDTATAHPELANIQIAVDTRVMFIGRINEEPRSIGDFLNAEIRGVKIMPHNGNREFFEQTIERAESALASRETEQGSPFVTVAATEPPAATPTAPAPAAEAEHRPVAGGGENTQTFVAATAAGPTTAACIERSAEQIAARAALQSAVAGAWQHVKQFDASPIEASSVFASPRINELNSALENLGLDVDGRSGYNSNLWVGTGEFVANRDHFGRLTRGNSELGTVRDVDLRPDLRRAATIRVQNALGMEPTGEGSPQLTALIQRPEVAGALRDYFASGATTGINIDPIRLRDGVENARGEIIRNDIITADGNRTDFVLHGGKEEANLVDAEDRVLERIISVTGDTLDGQTQDQIRNIVAVLSQGGNQLEKVDLSNLGNMNIAALHQSIVEEQGYRLGA